MAYPIIQQPKTFGRRLNLMRRLFKTIATTHPLTATFKSLVPPDPRRVHLQIASETGTAITMFYRPFGSTLANGMAINLSTTLLLEFSIETSYGLCQNGLDLRASIMGSNITVLETLYIGG